MILHTTKSKRKKLKLPAVYALVFYHGKTTPYPYSMKLLDCFDDPYNILQGFMVSEVPLIDVNQLDENTRSREQALDIMTLALRKGREREVQQFLLNLATQLNAMDLSDYITLQFVRSTINYIFGVGDTKSIKAFVKHSAHLPQPIRGEIMTGAEYFEQQGMKKGIEQGMQQGLVEGKMEVAKNLLKEGFEPQMVARTTGLSLEQVRKLKH